MPSPPGAEQCSHGYVCDSDQRCKTFAEKTTATATDATAPLFGDGCTCWGGRFAGGAWIIGDVLIIGCGHNGLVCAAYLAGAELKMRALERRPIDGGAAVTEEFYPGCRNSLASYTVSLLNPKYNADLRLARHGVRVV